MEETVETRILHLEFSKEMNVSVDISSSANWHCFSGAQNCAFLMQRNRKCNSQVPESAAFTTREFPPLFSQRKIRVETVCLTSRALAHPAEAGC
jgi:hypothetical protein